MRKLSLLAVIAILVTAFGISPVFSQDATATPETDSETTSESTGDMSSNGYVRFAHFAPDLGAADVSFNNELSEIMDIDANSLSEWVAVPAGTYTVSLAADQAAAEPFEFTVGADEWKTIIAIPNSEESGVTITEVTEDHNRDTLLPGTARIIFVNALGGDQVVNFNRDDVPFFSELGSVGAEDNLDVTAALPVDAGLFKFSVTDTASNQVVAELADHEITDTSTYLFAVVGGDSPELLVHETTFAEEQLVRGELEEPGTIIEASQANELLAPFMEAVEIAGLTEQLSGEGPFTIFAPVDFAMDDILEQYRNDPETLRQILLNHVVEGDMKSTEVFNSDSLSPMSGETLTVEQTEQGFVNGAQIIDVNIPATNGTIHIINDVLLPQNLVQG